MGMTVPIEPHYRTVSEQKANGEYHFTAHGPGLGYHKPYFDSESDAQTFCVTLMLAFRAGKQARSRELRELLEDGLRR